MEIYTSDITYADIKTTKYTIRATKTERELANHLFKGKIKISLIYLRSGNINAHDIKAKQI